MLSVRLSREAAEAELAGTGLSVAAINSPGLCVVAGPTEAVDRLKAQLDARGIRSQKLHTSHAFHTPMMDAAVPAFLDMVRTVQLSAPSIPIVSTVTGVELGAAQAQDPMYWARHITLPVNFAGAVKTLWAAEHRVLLEIGPRGSMSALAMAQVAHRGSQIAIASLEDASADHLESRSLARAVGQLWTYQIELDWAAYFGPEVGRVPLPTYPFERKRYWVDPQQVRVATQADPAAAAAKLAEAEAASDVEVDPAVARAQIVQGLKSILEEVSGEDLQAADTGATFFELGLDSLLLTPITYMVKERFGVAVTFRQLQNDLSTLDALSAHVAAASRKSASVAASPAKAPAAAPSATTDDARAFAATPAQRAMLAREAEEPAKRLAHLESVTLELAGELRKDALEAAMKSLLVAHDALRASFAGEGSQLRVDARPAMPEIRWLVSTPAELQALIDEEMRRPFDVRQGAAPLLRFAVIALGAQQHRVLMTAHAAVCDRWSLDVLIEELAQAYGAYVASGSVTPAPAEQYEDYAAHQRERAQGEKAVSHQAYWAAERAALPAERASAAQQVGGAEATRIERIAFTVEAAQLAALKEASAGWRCSLFNTLFGALHATLHAHAESPVVRIATPFAGQSSANIDLCRPVHFHHGRSARAVPPRHPRRGFPRLV